MSAPIAYADLIQVVNAVSFEDYTLFKRRQSFVREMALDEATIVAKLKMLLAMRVAFAGSRFDLEIRGVCLEPAFVIGVLDEAELVTDLVAWPIDYPTRMATFAGHAALLGAPQLDTWPLFGPALPVRKTAVGWIRAGCVGVAPIDRHRAARAFIAFDGEQLVAEDTAHAAELAAARAELVDRAPSIMVAGQRRTAA